MMARPIEFQGFGPLPPQLANNSTFKFLHEKVAAIDAEVNLATSRKHKLKVVTQTAAVHLTCLKIAKAVAIAEEGKCDQDRKIWTKAMVKIADRAQDARFLFDRLHSFPVATSFIVQ